LLAGGKGKVIFIHTIIHRGQFGKKHFDFGKHQRFSLIEFRECTSLGKRREKSKIFIC